MNKMKAVWIICLILFFTGCDDDNNSSSTTTTSNNKGFAKQVTVFGIPVKATGKVSDDKLLHAASVMAEYLDNNEDGTPDNQEVVDELTAREAVLLMFENETGTVFGQENKYPENGQDLYGEETHPEGSQNGSFDASLEEVLHLITHVGYANVYPLIFGETGGSEVANAMDTARGGHFEEIPAAYPEHAWYTYFDDTCGYSCQVTEYTYWAMTSILGAQDYEGRLEEIQNEWTLNTREKVQTQDPAIYTILTDPQYALPRVLPDGDYNGATLTITRLDGSTATPDSVNRPDPSLGIETVPDALGSKYTGNFNRYTKVAAPNGKPIHIFAQTEITNEQMVRARSVLQHYLTDLPDSQFGEDKSEVANKMADNNAALLLLNGKDDGSNEMDIEGQPLFQEEIQVEGGSWYINQDYENHRDATFEEILHMVHDYGIGVDGKNSLPGALPEYQSKKTRMSG